MRFPRALAAAALTLGLIAVGAPAAQAAPVDTSSLDYSTCEFREGQLPEPMRSVGTGEETAVVYVRGSNCGTFNNDLGYAYPTNAAGDYLYLHFDIAGAASYSTSATTFLQSDPYSPNFYSGDLQPDNLMNSAAGKKLTGTIDLPDGTTRPFPGPQFTLKRKTSMLVQDAPSKVKKSKSFLVYAIVNVADWDLELDVGLSKQKVQLQSKTAGGHYKKVKTVTSRTGQQGGSVEVKVKITKATCFRWVYAGSSTKAPLTSKSDCVKIKK